MYFIIGLQQSNVYDSIMVVVNRLSKYGLFVVLCNTFSAQTVFFFAKIVRLHWIRSSIVSDNRDPTFTSCFVLNYFSSRVLSGKLFQNFIP